MSDDRAVQAAAKALSNADGPAFVGSANRRFVAEAAAKATTWHMAALDDLAACVAERDEARAEVERLRGGSDG